MKVLLIGAGGREHALAWKLAAEPLLGELHAAPGNPGIARHAECHPLRPDDHEGVVGLCRELGVELAVVGPEAPLVGGIADELRRAGIAVFGPSRAAAGIEGSKLFAKGVMRAAGVPAPATKSTALAPCVVKADGLAAGKGVFVCRSQADVEAALRTAAHFASDVFVEELLEGEELSLFALCDGANVVPLAPAQDFKRLRDGDLGPNTGGMGSYSPVPGVGSAEVEELLEAVHRPVVAELARRGAPFAGLLYAGLMLTERGPHVLEFNCRFGDPEAQSIVPTLRGGLLEALAAAATGDLSGLDVDAAGAAVTVVLAAGGYPERGDSGAKIDGIETAEAAGALVFHAGTALHDDGVVTNGGRVLDVTAFGETIAEARRTAYAAAGHISFEGMQYRRDIALAAAGRELVAS